ncbi:Helix-turn-helix domain [Moraxella caprae]|uniref:Helix-turn-helix domain n=1 Tax=Moraxella caprae TaxID=90240 RepID=A0A378QW21_9GAMM|nr:helix-turn-helix transcriptional regulator [Moraxella caprae]STZ07184.1 Helix-turn-helix domain [Moraxella caprae]
MFDIQEVALRLTSERATHGFSQNALAEKTGKSRQQYINYETGRSEMTVGFLYALDQLGFDIYYIITGVRNTDSNKPVSEPQGQTNNIQGGVSGVLAGAGSTVHQVNTQKHITKTVAEVKPGIEHITDEQRANLKRLVDEVVELEQKYRTAQSAKGHQAVWASLNKKMKVPKYSLIPLDKYETARKHLQSWIGRLSDTKTAKKTDTDAVRKRQYAYIHTNIKKLGLDDWYRNYLQERHGVTSSTELDDVRLKQAYQAVAYKVRMANK